MNEPTILPTAQWLEHPHINIEHNPIVDGFDGSFVGFGSCFAQNLKAEIEPFGFNFWYNRIVCGHYSSESLVNILEPIAQRNERTPNDLISIPERPGEVVAYRHFFKRWFYGPQATEHALQAINAADEDCRRQISTCTYAAITLGTSRIMRSKIGQLINAGSGLPSDYWTLEVLSVEQNLNNLKRIYDAILKIREGRPLRAMFLTISPQRYLFGKGSAADPFVDNMLSKSILRVAVSKFIDAYPDIPAIYFPSYEIVLDELRLVESISHYDFTHIDQVHTPKYVVKRFLSAYCSTGVFDQLSLIEKFNVLHEELTSFLEGNMPPDHPFFFERVTSVLNQLYAIQGTASPAIIDRLKKLLELVMRAGATSATVGPRFHGLVDCICEAIVRILQLSDGERRTYLLALKKGMLDVA